MRPCLIRPVRTFSDALITPLFLTSVLQLRSAQPGRTLLIAGQSHQRPGLTGTTNHWFAAYDVRQFADPERFADEVRGLRQRIQSNPPRRGFDQVLAPGDIENTNAKDYAANGIPLEQFTLDELAWVAEHTGIPLLSGRDLTRRRGPRPAVARARTRVSRDTRRRRRCPA